MFFNTPLKHKITQTSTILTFKIRPHPLNQCDPGFSLQVTEKYVQDKTSSSNQCDPGFSLQVTEKYVQDQTSSSNQCDPGLHCKLQKN